jgi:hypothetical protein
MPILLYITMWSCMLGMSSAFAPAMTPLDSESAARRLSAPRE